jgi:hypothetical protein
LPMLNCAREFNTSLMDPPVFSTSFPDFIISDGWMKLTLPHFSQFSFILTNKS